MWVEGRGGGRVTLGGGAVRDGADESEAVLAVFAGAVIW